jgi:arginyl-tRNA synthetase
MNDAELENLYESLGIAALKFFILKVDPKKRMLFNPAESIDFQGDTGPFVLYTYARINSVLKQAGSEWQSVVPGTDLHSSETETLSHLYNYPKTVLSACNDYSPAVIAQYCLDLAKSFNRLYNELPLLRETDQGKKALRLKTAVLTANTLKNACGLLGIKMVERM